MTQSVVVFEVALSRAGEIARTLMGTDYKGIVISDRYSGYGWLDESQRQLCWAHIKRDLTAEKGAVKIAVVIKNFFSPSEIQDLENALGQYILYQNVLQRIEPERFLYLAIREAVFY